MGKVYYDMGFLANAEVVECSATDLVGQYVGQTGPKAQKLLEKALGKVLFIDEAYRLAEGAFATEAMDEIVDCLTKPKFAQKLVTILAGYDADINRLMSINPGLTSRFPEAVIFNHLSPEECLNLLTQLLKKKKSLDTSVLDQPSEILRNRLLEHFSHLSKLPSWGNARDIQSIVKSIFGSIISTSTLPIGPLVVTEQAILSAAESMISERFHRSQTSSSARHAAISSTPLPLPEPLTQTPPAINTTTQTSTSTSGAMPPSPPPPPQQLETEETPEQAMDETTRDPGVTDEIWQQLEQDKRAAEAQEREHDRLQREGIALQERAALELCRAEAEVAALKAAADAVADAESKRRHEEARLKRELERREREAELAEIERKRKEKEAEKKREALAQKKLRDLGVCPVGYRWIKQMQGYRCAGGSHFVSDTQLGLA
jgi:ATPase family associated with various cellular activities (AAA)